MASKIKLNISTPCSENWDKMDRTEKGRFCQACQKQVIDFTGMSEQQLALFFKNNKKDVCGRLTDEQLSNELSIPRKRIHWFRYFLQVAIPAMIFSSRGNTQDKVTVKQPVSWTRQYKDSLAKREEVMHSVSMDTITKTSTPVPESGQVRTGYIGYISFGKVKKLDKRRAALKEIDEAKELLPCMKDPNFTSFNVFPNPLVSGVNLNIELISQFKEGYYSLVIVTIDGKRVFARNDLWIDRGTRIMNIAVPPLMQGDYALGLRNKKEGKIHSQLVVIKAG